MKEKQAIEKNAPFHAKKNSILDKSILFFSVLGMSVPSFFSSIIVAWFFAYLLHDYTGLYMTGSLYEVDDYGRGQYMNLNNLILPAFTLGIRPLSVIIQLLPVHYFFDFFYFKMPLY